MHNAILCDDEYYENRRYKLYPTEEQKELIEKFINLYRAIYNWGLNKEQECYKTKLEGKSSKGFYSFYELAKILKVERHQPGNEWMLDLPINTSRRALMDVINSYDKFFNKQAGFPKFKSKKRSPKIFKSENSRFYIDRDKLRFEGLIPNRGTKHGISIGFVSEFRKTQDIKFSAPTFTIDRFGQYWVKFSYVAKVKPLDVPQTEPIGIDVGIRKTLTLSTGEIYNRPNNKINRLYKRIKRYQRQYAKDIDRRQKEAKRTNTKYGDIPPSKRSQKRLNKINKAKVRITNIKHNYYHNTIKEILMQNPSAVVIENTNTKALLKRHHNNADQIAHADFYKIKMLIMHKCKKYGIPLIMADRMYPSSQICSNCGHRQKIGSSEIYTCPKCGMVMDRDINAALNLRNLCFR